MAGNALFHHRLRFVISAINAQSGNTQQAGSAATAALDLDNDMPTLDEKLTALTLAEQQLASSAQPNELYPECRLCGELMEMGPDDEPSAFCSECIFKVADRLAKEVVHLKKQLDALSAPPKPPTAQPSNVEYYDNIDQWQQISIASCQHEYCEYPSEFRKILKLLIETQSAKEQGLEALGTYARVARVWLEQRGDFESLISTYKAALEISRSSNQEDRASLAEFKQTVRDYFETKDSLVQFNADEQSDFQSLQRLQSIARSLRRTLGLEDEK